MPRITDRAGIPVPRRVQLLEADADTLEGAVASLRKELREGSKSNNRLLVAILFTMIGVLATLAANLSVLK